MSALPERRHLVHKAIDPSKLSAKTREKLGILDGNQFEGQWRFERKYDGCHMIAVGYDDGDIGLFSRSGEEVRSCDHIRRALKGRLRGKVLFGEAWAPGTEHRAISGAFRRHSEQPHLDYVVFDMVTLEDFLEGESEEVFQVREHRRDVLTDLLGNPKVYSARCDMSSDPALRARALANDPDDAYDGLVAKRLDGFWVAGAGRGGEVVKVKDSVTYDLEVIGVEEGVGKHAGRLGALVLRYKDGKELRVGTGFSDLQREAYWEARDVPGEIIGRIVEIVGLGDSKKGSVREPRFLHIRLDKTEADY